MENKIKEVLKQSFPDIDFTASEQLVEDGMMDSLIITGIIVALSDAFQVEIPLEEIVPENFNSITDMKEMIQRLTK